MHLRTITRNMRIHYNTTDSMAPHTNKYCPCTRLVASCEWHSDITVLAYTCVHCMLIGTKNWIVLTLPFF